jgi:hypothetical protein
MKSLAKAVVEAAAFLELTGDDVVNPDSAVQALESVRDAPRGATGEEKQAILDYCRDQASLLKAARSEQEQRRRDFYSGFGEAIGLTEP